jgi:transitional endoplasmic reticulum ATPase
MVSLRLRCSVNGEVNMLAGWRCRDVHPNDLDAIVRLVETVRGAPKTRPIDIVELLAGLQSDAPSVVAVVGEEIVGVAAASLSAGTAWVTTLALLPQWRQKGIGSAMLASIEETALHRGAFKVSALLGEGQVGENALRNRGFVATPGLILYEKREPVPPSDVAVLDAWGGELIGRDAWNAVAGMSDEKDLIDRRIIGPLTMPDLARSIGARPPSSVMLFGPPGTGKTTFARAIAGTLGWPFVELLPSKLAGGPAGLAGEVRRAFEELSVLEHVAVFIDEFDEIAPSRQARPEVQGVVNELLKAIPTFRSQSGRVLIVATNFVSQIDPAVLRPGRFDLVIPIGPPDADARAALWVDVLKSMATVDIDVARLVMSSEHFTPGDVMLAAQRAAAQVFHRARSSNQEPVITQADFDAAISTTVPSLSPETIATFRDETTRFSRT